MREILTATSLATAIRMLRAVRTGAILLVEGDTDVRVWRRCVHESCEVLPGHGKERLLATIAVLEGDAVSGVLGCVDADFAVLESRQYSTNVVVTDGHDMECVLLQSPALDAVLEELCAPDKIEELVAVAGPIRATLLSVTAPVGFIRWAALRNEWHIRFRGWQWWRYFNLSGADLEGAIRSLCTRTARCQVNGSHACEVVNELSTIGADLWHVASGHDLLVTLQMLLREVGRTRSARELGVDAIGAMLRLAMNPADLMTAATTASLRRWERRTGYAVLPQSEIS